ncbi:acyl-CoA thioesterase [Guptibacillus hwajinpoensis]|uniref:acyl-CoA thioesterase n=1 Tax=Guptibacillus hwajinpoensis TaxID=208199 RepID=UPI001CFD7F46|nr:thioesterase family protein [Pseudalkalibacillus hwajinpoensis]WLR61226.1 thioesterase family protein [Pseudalkalibacillus hwajinpoensis]
MYQKVIDPRVSETDGAGHINNTVIPVWFESGRDPIFRLFNPDLAFHDWHCVLLKMNVTYISQLYYGTPITVYTWIKRIGRTSFEVYEEIHQKEKVCVTGLATYVNYHFDQQKSMPIPDEIRRQLEAHLYTNQKATSE